VPEVTRPTGPLRPIELATAAVMAGVAVALTVIGWFLPHLGPVAALSVVPLGFVAHRHRFRALAAAAFAASVLSFMVGGTGTVTNIVECAVIGGLVGTARRRGWSLAVVMGAAAIIGPILALVSVGLLAIFSSLRKLTLEQIRNTWHGIERLLQAIPGTDGITDWINNFVNGAIRDWWITVAVLVIVSTLWFALLAWFLLGAVLDRLKWIRAVDRLDLPHEDVRPGPTPVSLHDVSYRYPGTEVDALKGVSLAIGSDEMVALLGDNGSGKSTLARLLAGRPPTGGTISRPGGAGLGQSGGTAMVLQHPETQILGVRVADDVVWGLRDARQVDVPELLRAVGLDGMEDRETSTLSGGELQRLAVAAALARHPHLLISDESTAMVDAEGRALLTGLLAELPATRGMAVVHITHRPEEAQRAGRRFRLAEGRLIAETPVSAPPRPAGVAPAATAEPMPPGSSNGAAQAHANTDAPTEERPAARRLELVDVSHTYGAASPWAQPALHEVRLTVEPNEGVLIVGGNGSGKSTLAWILAGVLRPSRGQCLLGGRPVTAQVGSVGLAFQHARLQLQRPTVAADMRAAGAADDAAVAAALASVGLDVADFGKRRIDELSGGQQRRVALAGLLARRPAVLVLDEPLAGLDEPSQKGLLDLLAGLRYDHGLTIIVISHDLEGTGRVCDRVIELDRGRIASDEVKAAAPTC
jgi:energy-coupling factor transport system ATP-binding protein